MITIKRTIFIKANTRKVWDIFTDLEKWPSFNPKYLYAMHVSGKPWNVGSKFKFMTKYGVIKSKSLTKILKCKPPEEVTWIGTKPFIKGKVMFQTF